MKRYSDDRRNKCHPHPVLRLFLGLSFPPRPVLRLFLAPPERWSLIIKATAFAASPAPLAPPAQTLVSLSIGQQGGYRPHQQAPTESQYFPISQRSTTSMLGGLPHKKPDRPTRHWSIRSRGRCGTGCFGSTKKTRIRTRNDWAICHVYQLCQKGDVMTLKINLLPDLSTRSISSGGLERGSSGSETRRAGLYRACPP